MLHVLGNKNLQNLFGSLQEKGPGLTYDSNNEMCIKGLCCYDIDWIEIVCYRTEISCLVSVCLLVTIV
jgi:hypothetical protein